MIQRDYLETTLLSSWYLPKLPERQRWHYSTYVRALHSRLSNRGIAKKLIKNYFNNEKSIPAAFPHKNFTQKVFITDLHACMYAYMPV